MIELFTGLPGSGKTLLAVQVGVDYVAQGRRVFVEGINKIDLAATGFLGYPAKIEEWATVLKPGDVLIVDEIQRYLATGSYRGAPPQWVEELTRNRHYGVDFIFMTQDATNLVPFVRKLVNVHVHLVNKYGAPRAKVYKWIDGVHDPSSIAEKKKAESFDWSYPENLYKLYKSAELHTREKKLPRKFKLLWAAIAAFVVLGVLGGYAAVHVAKSKDVPAAQVPRGAPSATGAMQSVMPASDRRAPMSTGEFFAQLRPRIPGVMWSAPAFDGQKVQSSPETYCIAVESGPCFCRSEQGTTAVMPDPQCRQIARNGLYNPFRRPERDSSGSSVDQRGGVVSAVVQPSVVKAAGTMASAVSAPPVVVGNAGQGAAQFRRLGDPYPAERFEPYSSQQ